MINYIISKKLVIGKQLELLIMVGLQGKWQNFSKLTFIFMWHILGVVNLWVKSLGD